MSDIVTPSVDLTNLPNMGADERILQPFVEPREPGGFFRNVLDQVANGWVNQQRNVAIEMFIPGDENFNPLAPDLIKGKEQYIDYLKEARSRQHFDAIFARLSAFDERRSRLQEDAGFASSIVAGIADPINYLPFGVGRGVGALRGALTGGVATAAGSVAGNLLLRQAAPVETSDIVADAAFSAVLGGLLGGIVGRGIPDNLRVSEIGNEISTFGKMVDDGIMTGAYGGNPLDPNVPPLPFVARPTGSSPTGIAPGFGLEKIVEKLTDFGRLVGSKVRSFEDLALSMGGTGQLMARNVAENAEASPQSALLRAGRWTGLAAHTLRNIDSIYMEYRTGGQKSLEVAGVNVPMTMMRVGSVFKKPANNLMTPQEFMREVSRAHKRDRLEHENPFVLKAAQETRKFYDEMRNAGIEVNQIMTLDTVKRSLDRMTSWTSGHQNRINQIEGKAKDSEGNINTKLLSNNELAELKVLREAVLHGRQRTQFYSGALTFMENKQKPGPRAAAAAAIPEREPIRTPSPANENVPAVNGVEVSYGPTGKNKPDGSPVIALYRPEENKIYFDREAADAAWQAKAWRNPKMEGVTPLPDELFPTPDDWANFIMRHELSHVTVRRGAELNGAEYENLINDIARRQLEDLQRPVAVTTGAAKIDDAAMNVANENYRPFLGPENEQFYLQRIWNLDKILADEAGDKILRKVLTNWFLTNPLTPDEAKLDRAIAKMNDINLSIDNKKQRLGDIISSIESSIETRQKYAAYLERKFEEVGLTEKEIATLDYFKARSSIEGIVGPTPAQAEALENLRDKLFNTAATKKQRDYLAILDRQAQGELLKKASVARAEARAAGMGMGGMEESIELKAIEARVNRTIANILKEAEQGELSVGRSNREFLISRDLNIPNELVWDFIEDDVGSLIRSYSHRAGRAFEYARMFGERDAKESIYDSAINAARELKGSPDFIAQEVSKLIGHAENLRDFTLGDVYSKNPLSLTRKAAQALSAFGTVTSLGGALISSLNEITRPIMMHGINRTIGFAFNALSDREAFKGMSYELKTLTGQGWDTALGMTMSRFGEQGGPMNGAIDWAGKALDKTTRPLINFANGPYFVANLLGPFTDILKNYSNVMNAHFFIEDAKAIVDGTASKRVRGNFTAAGLDIDDAARILAMPVEKDRALNVTNLAAWGDAELSRKFASAIASKTMQQVVTATEADMPNITRGFIGRGEDRREIALLRLPFQFMNYSFAALNKNLLSALQGREANVFAGLTAMVGAAYLSQYLKASSSAWDKTPMEERLLRSIEGSGMLSLFGDINQKIEGLSRNEYGARSVLGMPPKYGDFSLQQNPAGDIMGPAFGKVTDLFGVVFDKDQNQKQDVRAIRRSIPLNDIFYMKSIFNYGEKAALD